MSQVIGLPPRAAPEGVPGVGIGDALSINYSPPRRKAEGKENLRMITIVLNICLISH